MSHAGELGPGNSSDGASPNQGVLGDWGGARTRLYQRGIDFQFGYTAELAYNARGGDAHLLRHADQFNFGVTFDLQRLLGWQGAKVQLTITDRNGDNLSADANLGTRCRFRKSTVAANVFRLTQLWYEQALFDNTLNVKVGRMGVGEDFMPFSCYFQNLSFCGSLPGNIVSTWYNWPVSQWAARVRVNFTPRVVCADRRLRGEPRQSRQQQRPALEEPGQQDWHAGPARARLDAEPRRGCASGRVPRRFLVRHFEPAGCLSRGERAIRWR
jgi:hypothetical protein